MKTKDTFPIIHPFIYNGKCYIYDTNKNEILMVERDVFAEIKKFQANADKYLLSQDNVNKNIIFELIDRGYLGPTRIQDLHHPLSEYVYVLPDRKTNNLILQITQKCNFKCRYCSFTEIDAFERNHSSISMNWDVAKKAIDFLFEKSRDSLEVNIGFYGGEPFLEFPLIKKCINYAESIFETKNINFYATTNASVLSDDIVNYLVSHNFNLRVSLDGPEDIQDKHRRCLKTGRGTYKQVIDNIMNIKEKYPDYFQTITYNPVIFSDENPSVVKEFFVDFLDVSETSIRPTYADTRGFDYIYNYTATHKSTDKNDNFEDKINRENISKYVLSVLKRYEYIPKSFSHSGPCLAGSSKVFCSTEGKLYPCEKITECEWSTIGNLDDGYDYDQIYKLTNICKLSENECKYCWAIRFCKICAAQCCNGPCEDIKAAKSYMCESIKKNAEDGLRKYIDITIP